MRVLTEYQEGGGPKEDILQADSDEEMEVNATGGSDAGQGTSDSECDEGATPRACASTMACQRTTCQSSE
jgi:hypothetical protein